MYKASTRPTPIYYQRLYQQLSIKQFSSLATTISTTNQLRLILINRRQKLRYHTLLLYVTVVTRDEHTVLQQRYLSYATQQVYLRAWLRYQTESSLDLLGRDFKPSKPKIRGQ